MQDTGHPGNTPGCISPFFLPENASGICFAHLYTPHDIIAIKVMPSSGRAHPQLQCVKI